ncbi:MAG: pectinesterase family protein [Ferruginibacter sp.]
MKKKILLTVIVCCSLLFARAQTKFTVAKEGKADFNSVQAAVNAVPADNKLPVVIHIKKGTYKEVVIIPAGKDFISFIGDDSSNTILTYDNHTGTVLPDGSVADTRSSPSCFIYANDFHAANITFENNAGFTAGQAVALRVDGDRVSFKNCSMVGFQDVLLLNGIKTRNYFKNCYIEGTTDFIFGSATAIFENCHIHSKKNSHVTAASTPAEVPYGFVFFNCRLTGNDSLNKVSLGRPWRPYSSVTYINCDLGKHIIPEGWSNWKGTENDKTARYAEYNSSGPGADPAARVPWSKQLSSEEMKQYTLKNIFGEIDWIK